MSAICRQEAFKNETCRIGGTGAAYDCTWSSRPFWQTLSALLVSCHHVTSGSAGCALCRAKGAALLQTPVKLSLVGEPASALQMHAISWLSCALPFAAGKLSFSLHWPAGQLLPSSCGDRVQSVSNHVNVSVCRYCCERQTFVCLAGIGNVVQARQKLCSHLQQAGECGVLYLCALMQRLYS